MPDAKHVSLPVQPPPGEFYVILRYCILRLGNGISDECVEDVYGDDSRQGAGIGAKLVNYAHKIAKERGYRTIRLMGRSNVVEFYKKLGYTPTGVVENYPQVTLIEMTIDL